MPQAHRVLHLYLAYNYVPRVGRHSTTTYSDLWIMYRLLNNDLINFWDIMVTNFKKVTNGPNRALLRHSRLITALLQRKGIQFVFPSRSVSSEPFTMAHLTKGDWRRANDGSFVRREPLSPIDGITLPSDGDGDDDEDDDDDDGAPAADIEAGDDSAPPAPAPPPSSPMAAPMHIGGPPGSYSGASSSFDLAQEFHNFRLDVNRRLDDLSTTQNQLQTDLHDFFQHFYSIHPRPPPPPPPSDD